MRSALDFMCTLVPELKVIRVDCSRASHSNSVMKLLATVGKVPLYMFCFNMVRKLEFEETKSDVLIAGLSGNRFCCSVPSRVKLMQQKK